MAQRAGAMGDHQSHIANQLESEVNALPIDKMDNIYKLILEMYSGAQTQIELAKLEAAASVVVPKSAGKYSIVEESDDEFAFPPDEVVATATDYAQEVEIANDMGLETGLDNIFDQVAAYQQATAEGANSSSSADGSHKMSILASQAFDVGLHEAASKRQRCRANFPKGLSPRAKPKPKSAVSVPNLALSGVAEVTAAASDGDI